MTNLALPGEVEGHRLFPGFFRSIYRQRAAAACTVDQNVRMAKPAERRIAKPYSRVSCHEVLSDQQRARSLRSLDLVRKLIEKPGAASHRCDLNTLGSQSFCNRPADPHARPGNQRGLTNKLQIPCFPRKTSPSK